MKIPVLTYHSISDTKNFSSVSINNFNKQMLFMKKSGFQTYDFKSNNFKKKFIITFDDGYEDVFVNALPILLKYNFKAICFFVSDFIGKDNQWDINHKNYNKLNIMNISQIQKWIDHDMLVGSHTATHKNLKKLSQFEKKFQIYEPINFFKKNFNIQPIFFSYPFGAYDSESVNIVKSFYKFAFTTKRGRYNLLKINNLEIPRIPINQKDSLFKFFLKTRTFYEDIK